VHHVYYGIYNDKGARAAHTSASEGNNNKRTNISVELLGLQGLLQQSHRSSLCQLHWSEMLPVKNPMSFFYFSNDSNKKLSFKHKKSPFNSSEKVRSKLY